MKKYRNLFLILVILCLSLCGCGSSSLTGPSDSDTTESAADSSLTSATDLADGSYDVEFHTDSSMFHVNEACDGMGVLTVTDGQMSVHISLASKNIVNLFLGTAEEAQQDGAVLLEPTTDTVTYSDGSSEDVYGFDIPVSALDEDFQVAIIGTKGTWYDHTVSVSSPQ